MGDTSLYGQGEQMQNETVKVELAPPGSYTAVIGKTYNLPATEGKRGAVVTDFFLVFRTNKEVTDSVQIMQIKNEAGKQVLNFIQTESGKPKIFGALFKHRNNLPKSGDTEGFINMSGVNRRQFARALGAYDEKTQVVDWTKIQSLAGRFVVFNLVERGNFLNIDLPSLQLLETGNISLENLVHLYTVIETAKREREAMQSGAPVGAAPPPAVDLPF